MIGSILAGGENRRIPYIKGLLKVNGLTIIERNINILKEIFHRVVISTNSPELYFPFGVPLIGDIIKERGPMAGIFSLLVLARVDPVFVIACDMPFVKMDLIVYMKDRFEELSACNDIDAMAPRFNGKVEPLFGIYNPSIKDRVEESLRAGQKGLYVFLQNINTVYIEEQEIRDIDPDGLSFVNINTLDDYEKIGGKGCLV